VKPGRVANPRGVATVVLVVLTCALTLVSVLALWLRALVLNTDSYVRAIGPVLDHPAVRDSLAETIVAELYSHVDVAAQLRKALPDSAAEFAPTLAASIRTTSVQVASAALATSAVRQAWRQANRVAHDQVVHVLEGKDGVVTTAKGEVAIDTGGLAALVRSALDGNGIHLFDAIPLSALDQQFVLFRSTDLLHAQETTRALDDTATWLPFATMLIGVGAIACSLRRRRTALIVAVGVAAVMVVIAIGVSVGRAYYLARVGAQYRTIAGAPFDALVSPLRAWTRITFVAALGAAVIVWFTGSEALVAREQQARRLAVDAMRRHARLLEATGAAMAAALLVAWDKPRPLVVFTTLGVTALWEVACFVVGRSGRIPSGGTGPTAAPN
jgi:hypothetical protein